MSGFTHLHNHFDIGSPKDSTCKIDETIKYVKSLGFDSYAITDHGRIDGWINFNIACKTHNIKGIYGVELYEAKGKITEGGERYHSVMLARNKKGIDFLRKLVTFTHKRENIYYNPRYDLEYLLNHKEQIKNNIIWLTGCIKGRLPQFLLNDKMEEAKQYMRTMTSIFGKENVFIEIQDHSIEDEKIVLPKLVRFAKENNYELVATNDIHYIKKEHYLAREIMLARERKQTVLERKNSGYVLPSELYVKTEEEMRGLFDHIPGAINNSRKITNMIEDIDLEEKEWHFPEFDIPREYTDSSYMKKIILDNLSEKYPLNEMTSEKKKELQEKIDFEVETIKNMNTSAYMLIVSDFISEAKKRGIRVGPGRGSACGSIAAYLLGITDVDPLAYGLYFERFLNPERISMPDIDTDFQDDRREEIVQYVVEKYGKEKVAKIMTYGTVGARMAIRDVGAVLSIDPKLVDKVAKAIPLKPGITLEEALEDSPQFKDFYQNNPTAKELINKAKLIEGLVRHNGVHAAGVIISDKPLTKYGALMEEENSDIPVFLGDMKTVDYLKLLKMDFLGLKTLSIIQETLEMIEKNNGIKIDINNIKYDDMNVFEYIAKGETHGVFQLEQPGMQQFMKKLQPSSLEDVILGISVYRPGPMDSIPELIMGKRKGVFEYPEDAKHLLAPILDITYGIIVYQEQVMQIVRDLAGYSFGRSDLVRRAMSKKRTEIMEEERYVFIYGEVKCPMCKGTGKESNGDNCILCKGKGQVASKIKCPWCKDKKENCIFCKNTKIIESEGEVTVEGCLRRGISEKTASLLFDRMIDFASYAFNKSHATAYAIIAYQTAYLKYYYPQQYMTAYLNSVITNQEKVRKYIGVVKKMGIPILRPDINECEAMFTQRKEGICMGLTSIKNIGNSIKEVIAERQKNGNFKSLEDLTERVLLGKKELESLIKSGSLDCFKHKRSQMLNSLDNIVKHGKNNRKIKESGQITLFENKQFKSLKKFNFSNIREFSPMQIYTMEKEVSGFYLSGHPLDLPEYKNFVKQSNITTIDEFSRSDDRKTVVIIGILQINEKDGDGFKRSRAGKEYALYKIEDKYSELTVLSFENCVKEYGEHIKNGNIVKLVGSLSVQVDEYENKNGEIEQNIDSKIFANIVEPLNVEVTRRKNENNKRVYICINSKEIKKLPLVRLVVDKHPGIDELYIYLKDSKKILKFEKPFGYNKKSFKCFQDIFKGEIICK